MDDTKSATASATPPHRAWGSLGAVLVFGIGITHVHADATATYRDGLEDYSGTRAVAISSLGLTASGYGMNGTTFLDGGDWCIGDLPNSLGYDVSPLVRFDGVAPVAGEHVAAATLRVHVNYWGSKDVRVVARYLAAPWATVVEGTDGAGIGWRTRLPGVPWTALGAEGEGTDVLASAAATSAVLAEGEQTIDLALDPAIVQEWIDAPSSNHGVVLRVDVPNEHVGFVPPLSTKADERPTLVLQFQPGPSPNPLPVDAGPGTGGPTARAPSGGCTVRARPSTGAASWLAPTTLAWLVALRVRRARRT